MLKIIKKDRDGNVVNALVFKDTKISGWVTAYTNSKFDVEVSLHGLNNDFPDCRFLDVAEDILILIITAPRNLIRSKLFLIDVDYLPVHVRDSENPAGVENDALGIQSWLVLDVENWRAPFSPNQYLAKLRDTIEGQGEITMKLDSDFYLRFFLNPNPTDRISNEVNKLIDIVKACIEESETQLTDKLEDSIVTTFRFPESVSTSCEQYLLYFVQFLRDVGVEANSQITHEAGKVLFFVTPLDKNQALDKVRAALDAYLRLPSSPIANNDDSEIAVKRLESAVLRLQSDLRLTVAEIQAKNATIEAQQISLGVYRGILNGDIVINSMVNPNSLVKEPDREEVLDGLAAITVFKKDGFEVNLPKLYRMVKGWFADK